MKTKTKPTPKPFDGCARTVDELLDRLDCILRERDAILEELKRQSGRAKVAIEKSWSTAK